MLEPVRQFINRHFELTDVEFRILASKLHLVNFDKKTKLVGIGDVATNVYFVLKGITRRYFYRGKQEIITHLIKEGGLMGSVISFLTGEPSRYVLETIEPVTAYSISKKDIEELFESDKRWEKFGRKILTAFFIQIEYHNIDMIRYSTRERFINFMKENPDLVQTDAMQLLTPKQIFELKGGVIGALKTAAYSTGVLNTNSDMKRLFESGVKSYEAYENIAVRREQSRVIKQGVKYDQWYKQKENYYIRYFPESYKKVRIQVYVPEGILDADNKLNGDYVVFDPTGQQATPAFTNAQRLGIGAPVIDVIKAVIKVNKQQPVPKKQPEKTNPKNPKTGA